MSTPISLSSFDPLKPFYPLVMHYYLVLEGFRQISIATPIALWPQFLSRDLTYSVPDDSPKAQEALKALKKAIHVATAPGTLRSSVTPNAVLVDSNAFSKEILANHQQMSNYAQVAAGNLLILAHEVCKDKPEHDRGLLWEFLRHCRNGAAHGGKFNLLNGEPKRPAKWRTLEILPSLNGTNVIGLATRISGLLLPADPILLLWDIEQAYPNLK
jgi:hypothetical protein